MQGYLRRYLREGFGEWRGPIVEAFFKLKAWHRWARRRDSGVTTGSVQNAEVDHRRRPVSCILGETLPFRLRGCVDLDGLNRGGRIIPRIRIARRHAHYQRAHSHQNDSQVPLLARAIFEMAQQLHLKSSSKASFFFYHTKISCRKQENTHDDSNHNGTQHLDRYFVKVGCAIRRVYLQDGVHSRLANWPVFAGCVLVLLQNRVSLFRDQ